MLTNDEYENYVQKKYSELVFNHVSTTLQVILNNGIMFNFKCVLMILK